jgi:hypothetical protein
VTPRTYCAHGDAGCVERRRCRATSTMVSIYHAAQAGLDESGGSWVTVCEDHGSLCNHPTLELARRHRADPWGWCDECRERENQKP